MIVEPYPLWEISKASEYKHGSKVSWFDIRSKQTYGYKANSLYKDGKVNGVVVEPPEYFGWTIDPYYVPSWKSDEKYAVGNRVYFEVGDPTKGFSRQYIYLATSRYFGGNGPPNEELDEDGIRTWTLWFEPQRSFSDELFLTLPFRKLFNLRGRDSCTDPEEFYNYTAGLDDSDYYFRDDGKQLKSPPSDSFNSIFESNPYDEYVYEFKKTLADNTIVPRRKGVHMAELRKEQGLSWAKRQHNYTDYRRFTSAGAESPYPFFIQSKTPVFGFLGKVPIFEYGFSMEMWPNISYDDFELTTHNVKGEGSNVFIDILFDGGSASGEMEGGTGSGGSVIPPQSDKTRVVISTNNHSFINRTVTFKLGITTTTTTPTGDGTTTSRSSFKFESLALDTNEDSYKSATREDGTHKWELRDKDNGFDWSNRSRSNTEVGIGSLSVRIR